MANMKELYKKAEVLAELDQRLDSMIVNYTDEKQVYEDRLKTDRELNPDMTEEEFRRCQRYTYEQIEGYEYSIKACKELKTEICKLLK